MVDSRAFWRLASGFLATRENPNTRAAYARDLDALTSALGIPTVEATDDTPFLQIGEHKYGKPILDRVARNDMRLGEAAKLLLLSFDSTLRSNLSVGMPIDMLIYEKDKLDVSRERRIEQNDDYFKKMSASWSDALRHAFSTIDEFKF